MEITEPMTMLTDYALAALSSLLAIRLFRSSRREGQTSQLFWAAAFVATAGAAAFGGTYHGFYLYLSRGLQAAFWKATVYSVGLVSFFMLSAAIRASVVHPVRGWLLGVAGLKLAVYGTWMVTHDEFRYVIYDYVPAMLGVIFFQAYEAYRRAEPSGRWIIAGVLVSFFAAGVQQSGLGLHENFNHNDLYHTIQMGALYLLSRGGQLLKDR